MTRPRAVLEDGVVLVDWPDTGERARYSDLEANALRAVIEDALEEERTTANRVGRDRHVIRILLARPPLEPIPPAGEPIPETGPAAYQGELTFDELVSFRLELLTAALGARQHRPPPASRLPYPEATE